MEQEKYKLTVNEKFEYTLEASDAMALDIIEVEGGSFHLLHDGKSYQAELVALDKKEKKVLLKLDGRQLTVNIADKYDQLLNKMGLSASIIHKISEVKAPMPGLVLSILVEPGQQLVHGDPLLILEAMKMENILKSPGEGTVKNIRTSKGKAVEKGEILIELE